MAQHLLPESGEIRGDAKGQGGARCQGHLDVLSTSDGAMAWWPWKGQILERTGWHTKKVPLHGDIEVG